MMVDQRLLPPSVQSYASTLSNLLFRLPWLDNEDDIWRAESLLSGEFERIKGTFQVFDT